MEEIVFDIRNKNFKILKDLNIWFVCRLNK